MPKRLTITDTHGNPLPRNSAAAVRRVLKSPAPITSTARADFAMCNWNNSWASVSVIRDGVLRSPNATFTLVVIQPSGRETREVLRGLADAVHRFLDSIRFFYAQAPATTR